MTKNEYSLIEADGFAMGLKRWASRGNGKRAVMVIRDAREDEDGTPLGYIDQGGNCEQLMESIARQMAYHEDVAAFFFNAVAIYLERKADETKTDTED